MPSSARSSSNSVCTGLPQGLQCQGGNKLLGAVGHDDAHFCTAYLQFPDQLRRLVCRYAAADTEQDIAIEKMCHLRAQSGRMAGGERYHCAVVFDTAPQELKEERNEYCQLDARRRDPETNCWNVAPPRCQMRSCSQCSCTQVIATAARWIWRAAFSRSSAASAD